MLPPLPTAIWVRIITFLAPDHVDGIDKRVDDQTRKRQAQLAALLTVSRTVYESIIPALYAEPIVTTLPIFIASAHPGQGRGSGSGKKSPFEYVRTLHLALPTGPSTPEVITAHCTSLVNTINLLLRCTTPFPHLHLVTLGRYPTPDTGWSTFHLDIAGSPRQSIIAQAQRSVFALIKHLNPAVIHQYTSSGPLAFSYRTLWPPFVPSFPSDPLYNSLREAASFVLLEYPSGLPEQRFIHQSHTSAISYPLIRRSINEWRIIYNHGDLAIYNDQTESKLGFTLALDVAGAIRQWRIRGVDVGETWLEIVGMGCKMEAKRQIWIRSARYRREMSEKYRMPVARSDYDHRTALAAEKHLAETDNLSKADMIRIDQEHVLATRRAFGEQLERLILKDMVVLSDSEDLKRKMILDWTGRISFKYTA